MNIYLAGPMTGYKDFNFPAFMAATANLRSRGHTVFSPAERDLERDGDKYVKNSTGNLDEAIAKGFNPRIAIRDDLNYIIDHADAIALLPGWEASKGVAAEVATGIFLGLKLITLDEDDINGTPHFDRTQQVQR